MHSPKCCHYVDKFIMMVTIYKCTSFDEDQWIQKSSRAPPSWRRCNMCILLETNLMHRKLHVDEYWNTMPLRTIKSQKATFNVKVLDLGVNWKGIISRVYMLKIKFLSLMTWKLYSEGLSWQQTDKQDKNNMPPIIRTGGIKNSVQHQWWWHVCIFGKVISLDHVWSMNKYTDIFLSSQSLTHQVNN